MPTDGPTPPPPSKSSHTTPLLAWLAIQLLVLLVPVMQVPLSDDYPRPAERLAIEQLACVQIAASALLFPLLLRSAGAAAILAAASWPFLQLAGILSSMPAGRVAWAGAYVTGWLALLALVQRLSRPMKRALMAVALTTAVALGGPLLWYLRADFAPNSPEVNWPADGMGGPIMGVLAVLHEKPMSPRPWIPLAGGLAVCGGLVAGQWGLKRWKNGRQPASRTPSGA